MPTGSFFKWKPLQKKWENDEWNNVNNCVDMQYCNSRNFLPIFSQKIVRKPHLQRNLQKKTVLLFTKFCPNPKCYIWNRAPRTHSSIRTSPNPGEKKINFGGETIKWGIATKKPCDIPFYWSVHKDPSNWLVHTVWSAGPSLCWKIPWKESLSSSIQVFWRFKLNPTIKFHFNITFYAINDNFAFEWSLLQMNITPLLTKKPLTK